MGTPDTIVAGVVCMRCSHEKRIELEKYEYYIREAARLRVRLLIFPEVSIQGYITSWRDPRSVPQGERRWFLDPDSPVVIEEREYYMREAEVVPGPTTDRISRLASEFDMTIQIGLAEKAGDFVHNSAALVGPAGFIGVYRKMHNQSERPIFEPGSAFSVFDTPVGKLGPLICADLAFPETTRILRVQGARLLTMSTAWPPRGIEAREDDPELRTYKVLADAAAITNQVWILQANQIGQSPKPGAADYLGHSRIVSPFGDEVARCGYEEALVCAEIPLGEIERQFRLYGNRLDRRRPELYGPLVEVTRP